MSSSKYEIKKIVDKYYQWISSTYPNRKVKREGNIFFEYTNNRLITISVLYRGNMFAYLPSVGAWERFIYGNWTYWNITEKEISNYLNKKYKLYIDMMML